MANAWAHVNVIIKADHEDLAATTVYSPIYVTCNEAVNLIDISYQLRIEI